MENKKTLLYIGISLGIITTIFSMGNLALAQSCDSNCVDECSVVGETVCTGSGSYKECGNFDCDYCLDWSDSFNCGYGQTCDGGSCVSGCTPKADIQCYAGDIYWYDSCNNRGTIHESCGDSEWGDDYQCSGSNLKREWINRGCSGDDCTYSTEWKDYGDCGTDQWTNNYQCSGNWTQRQVLRKGCGSDSCYSYYEWVNQDYCSGNETCSGGTCVTDCTDHDYKQCTTGDVYWYDSCNAKQEKYDECGVEEWTSDYQCSGDWIQRKKSFPGCSGAACTTSYQWINYTQCTGNQTCSGGTCVNECNSHDHQGCYNDDVYWYDSCNNIEEKVNECGIDEWDNDYKCSGDYVQRKWINRGCTGSSCYENTSWLNYQNCSTLGKTCSGGTCVWPGLNTTCYANPNPAQEGNSVTFYSTATGGSGSYTYSWSNACSGSSQNCSNTFNADGTYTANLSVSSGGETDTTSCTVQVNDQPCNCTSWSNWQDQSCGASTCGSQEMYQTRTRTCTNDCAVETENQCVYSASCQPQCNDECSSVGQMTCSGNGNKTCGNYDSDSCLEWGSIQSCQGSTSCGYGTCDNDEKPSWYCTGGACAYTCSYDNACGGNDHDYKQCYSNDVYWYSSNGVRNDKYSECGSDYTGNWGSDYCKGDDVYESRTTYDKGCSGSSCYSNTDTEERLVEHCDYDCQNGACIDNDHDYKQCYNSDVYWYSSNGVRNDKYSECGSDYTGNWGSDYCKGDDVYESRTTYDKGCSGSSCYANTDTEERLVKRCDYDCRSGRCVDDDNDYKQCYNNDVYWYNSNGYRQSKATECGSDYTGSWGSDYCKGDDVYERRTTYDKGCSGSSCYSYTDSEERLVKRCDDDCRNGKCVNDDDDDYKKCYNNDVYWYSDRGYRQSKAEECGSDSKGSWGADYCKGDNVYEQRYVYDRGCSGDDCYSNRTTEERLVKRCDDDCKNGKCIDDKDECDSSDPCCTNGKYKDDDVVCKSEVDQQYGCPWGLGCGADAGVRTKIRYRYCSGDSGSCNGDWGTWGNYGTWRVSDNCTANETCSVGKSTCSYNSNCSYTPPSNTKKCEDGDVYWFSPTGARLSKYDECSDANSCTQDSCSNATCYNELKCDGTTCSKTSDEYCQSCKSCGDGVANCNETFCSCPGDVELPATGSVAVSVLARAEGDYKKNVIAQPEDTIDFLVVVASSSDKRIDNITLDNILPNDIEYKGNLKINGIPFTGNVLAGLGLGSLSPNESKHITFEAKVADKDEFDTGTTYLSNVSKLTYENDQTKSDSVGIEIINGGQGVAAAGSLFSQALSIVGSLAFWLVMLFILAVLVFLGITGYYWTKKKRLAIYN
jgi:hypothetical protein